MPLTGGTVTFKRTVNLGNYENKTAEAQIGYSEPEDLKKAEAAAVQAVVDMLGGSIATKHPEQVAKELKAEIPKERKPRAKKEPEPEPAPAADFIDDGTTAAISTGESREEPIFPIDSAIILDDDPNTAAPPPVSDKELTDHINRKAISLKAKAGDNKDAAAGEIRRIKSLVAEFIGKTTGSSAEIKPELRHSFLEKLEAL